MSVIMPRLFSVIDTETTGLNKHPQADLSIQAKPIEFAGIITDGIEIIDQLEFICNPGQAIDEVITKITGLTNADLDNKSPFSAFVPQLSKFFGQAQVVVAHNLSFDTQIMQYAMARLGMTLSDINYPIVRCCTVEQTSPLYGYDRKLQDLYSERIGEYQQKHRAMDDIMMLHEVCIDMGIYKAFGGR